MHRSRTAPSPALFLSLVFALSASACGSDDGGGSSPAPSATPTLSPGMPCDDCPSCFPGTTVCEEAELAVCADDGMGYEAALGCDCAGAACDAVTNADASALFHVRALRVEEAEMALDLDLLPGPDAAASEVLALAGTQELVGDYNGRLVEEVDGAELVILFEVEGIDFESAATQQGRLRIHRGALVDAAATPPTYRLDETFGVGAELTVTWSASRLVSNTGTALLRFPFDVGTGGAETRTDQSLAGSRFELTYEDGALSGVLGGAGRVEPLLAGLRVYFEEQYEPGPDENLEETIEFVEAIVWEFAEVRIDDGQIRTRVTCGRGEAVPMVNRCNGVGFVFGIETEAAAWAPDN